MNHRSDWITRLLEREGSKLYWDVLLQSRPRGPASRSSYKWCEHKDVAAAALALEPPNPDAPGLRVPFDQIAAAGKAFSRRSRRAVFVAPPRDPETDARLLLMWREFVDFSKEYLQRHHEFEVLQYLLHRSERMPAAVAESRPTVRPSPAGTVVTPAPPPRVSPAANLHPPRLPQHSNLFGVPPFSDSQAPSPPSNLQTPPPSNSRAPQKPGLLLALPPSRQSKPKLRSRTAA